VTVQQSGPHAALQWGIYVAPKYKTGTAWVVRVYAGGVKIDGKVQSYEPHGSIGADKARKYSGKLLEVAGTGTHGNDQLGFSLKCYIS
jgi:hypothetical protein